MPKGKSACQCALTKNGVATPDYFELLLDSTTYRQDYFFALGVLVE